MTKIRTSASLVAFLNCVLFLSALVLPATPIHAADIIETNEIHATSDPGNETTPALGEDADGSLVTFTLTPILGSGYGTPVVAYQRLTDTGLFGSPVVISDGVTPAALNDVSGSINVYIASLSSSLRQVRAYDTRSGVTINVTPIANIFDVKVHGENIAWGQVISSGTVIVKTTRADSEAGIAPELIAGPVPPVGEVEIGSKWIGYEITINGSQHDIGAHNLVTHTNLDVANDPNVDEMSPATDGDWVVWKATNDQSEQGILAKNLDTGELRTIAPFRSDVDVAEPSIDGDFIAFTEKPDGEDAEIRLYRVSTGETYTITDDTVDQTLVNVFADRVAYIDNRNGNTDVFVTVFKFKPNPDGDGDGLPDETDACPTQDATGFDANHDGCIDNLTGLSAVVTQLINEGVIDDQMGTPLLTKVANAQGTSDKDQICAAVNQLQAFENQIEAQRGKKISDEAATLLIDYTNNVIAQFEGQLPEGEMCSMI
jgi:hypothetical protein